MPRPPTPPAVLEQVTAGQPDRPHFDDELGAQAMEYAMLTGAGVSMVSLLGWLVRQPWFETAMRDLFSGLLESLTQRIGDLLPALGALA